MVAKVEPCKYVQPYLHSLGSRVKGGVWIAASESAAAGVRCTRPSSPGTGARVRLLALGDAEVLSLAELELVIGENPELG
jgi:hypothetical protein